MYEKENHLGNVLVVISDKRITLCSNDTVRGYEADVVSATDYSAFGATLPGRTYSSPTYRYGFNGQEKDDEVSGEGNTNTAEFWEYDCRLGRRFNIDPKPNTSWSGYSTFMDNPLYFTDILGDTSRGNNATSGARMRDAISGSFKGDEAAKLRGLFTLASDGKTMNSISEASFVDAVKGLTKDQQQLAYAYYSAINSTDVHTVEMLYRNENISAEGQRNLGVQSTFSLGLLDGGGANTHTTGTTSYTAIIMNSDKDNPDYRDFTGRVSRGPSSAGELLAHEMLGHGVAGLRGQQQGYEAIQMSNLYLRAQGETYFRDGVAHAGNVRLSVQTANSVPYYYQLPKDLDDKINPKPRYPFITNPPPDRYLPSPKNF